MITLIHGLALVINHAYVQTRMVTDRSWRMEDKGCELVANRIPTKVMEITNGRAATVARPLRDEQQGHVFVSRGRNK